MFDLWSAEAAPVPLGWTISGHSHHEYGVLRAAHYFVWVLCCPLRLCKVPCDIESYTIFAVDAARLTIHGGLPAASDSACWCPHRGRDCPGHLGRTRRCCRCRPSWVSLTRRVGTSVNLHRSGEGWRVPPNTWDSPFPHRAPNVGGRHPSYGADRGESLSTSAQTGHVLSLLWACPVGGLFTATVNRTDDLSGRAACQGPSS